MLNIFQNDWLHQLVFGLLAIGLYLLIMIAFRYSIMKIPQKLKLVALKIREKADEKK